MNSGKSFSTAWYLLPAYLGLLIYASLYPFSAWKPEGFDVFWVAQQALPKRINWLSDDNMLNTLGYIPLGFLLCLALVRSSLPSRWVHWLLCWALATLLCSLWSWGIETVQLMLPNRVPSKLDWITNTAGAAMGAGMALALVRLGALSRWQQWRSQWLRRDSQAEVALLVLWPFALLSPTAVPLGLGQISESLLLLAQAWGLDAALAADLRPVPDLSQITALSAVMCTTLGLVVVACMGFLAVRSLWQRVASLVGLVFVAWFSLSLSAALSFGPKHSWAWWSVGVQAAFVMGSLLALGLVWLKPRALAVLASLALVWLLAVLNQASGSAYFWQTLQTWEQGRFIHFHGVARWLGLLWPYAALLVLLRHVFKPDPNAFTIGT